MKIYVLNTGGTLGMVGKPLRPAKSAAELLEGINVPKSVELTLEDFPERQDSTNVMHQDRVRMAQMVSEAYDDHDAFIILHGTDSLAETCAFLSMVFKRSLQKPLIVLGAQMTKDEVGSDVPMQVANSLRVAEVFVRNGIVGVYTVCIGDVLDGSRVRKRNEADFNAFYTPGRHPVAKAWPEVMIEDHARQLEARLDAEGLRLDTEFEQDVATIDVSADTPPWVLMDPAKAGRLKGVILVCKGAGQIPDREWDDGDTVAYSWIDAIKAATDAGVHVGIISPFDDGRVNLTRYELGQKAADAGAIGLESLTPAMGDAKFRMAIAKHRDDPARIQKLISADLVGELLPGHEDHS